MSTTPSTTQRPLSRRASSGEPRPPRTRSRERSPRTAAARASGIASAPRPARCATATAARRVRLLPPPSRRTSALMRELGLDAFRFSIAWPRILPEGRGRVNEPGLDFYDRFVDELLANGIEPFVTLYHWDLPQALEDAGGWPERATVEAFASTPRSSARRLGDRVGRWITQNEPWVIALARLRARRARAGAHRARRRRRRRPSRPARARPRGRGAPPRGARRPGRHHARPVADATRPASRRGRRRRPRARQRVATAGSSTRSSAASTRPTRSSGFAPVAPPVRDGDLETIAAPLDFLGVNYYQRHDRRPRSRRRPPDRAPGGLDLHRDGLGGLARRRSSTCSCASATSTTPPPIYITENGAAFGDVRRTTAASTIPSARPTSRPTSTRSARAIDAGVPVAGYFVWSLLDNFEWAQGYSKRFGIVYVDYPTLERVPKSSFHWYRDFIAGVARPPVAVS